MRQHLMAVPAVTVRWCATAINPMLFSYAFRSGNNQVSTLYKRISMILPRPQHKMPVPNANCVVVHTVRTLIVVFVDVLLLSVVHIAISVYIKDQIYSHIQ